MFNFVRGFYLGNVGGRRDSVKFYGEPLNRYQLLRS